MSNISCALKKLGFKGSITLRGNIYWLRHYIKSDDGTRLMNQSLGTSDPNDALKTAVKILTPTKFADHADRLEAIQSAIRTNEEKKQIAESEAVRDRSRIKIVGAWERSPYDKTQPKAGSRHYSKQKRT